jgi:ubiquinone/menaquinone biosynthesis C-methylase UbiE
MEPPVFPDELALAGPEHLDPGYVEAYERKTGFDPVEARYELELLAAHGFGLDSTLIDFGAGTGWFALAAAERCRRVVALDVSPAMIATIEAQAAERGVSNVEVVRAGFLSYEHVGERADFAYCRNALHHLPDYWKALALRRIALVLRPSGVLLLRDIVFSFEPEQAEQYIAAWLEGAAATQQEGWTREELETHLRNEFSTFTWLLEPMLERAGFVIVEKDYGTRRIFAEYVCVKRS